jgi:outer membrane biosynthesis protein TonB
VGYLQPHKADPTRWELVAAPVREGRTQAATLAWTEKAKGNFVTVWWVYRIADKDTLDYLAFRRVSQKPMTKVSKTLPPPEQQAAPAVKTPDKPKTTPAKTTTKPAAKPKTLDKPKTTPAKTTTKPAAKPKPPAAKPPADSE